MFIVLTVLRLVHWLVCGCSVKCEYTVTCQCINVPAAQLLLLTDKWNRLRINAFYLKWVEQPELCFMRTGGDVKFQQAYDRICVVGIWESGKVVWWFLKVFILTYILFLLDMGCGCNRNWNWIVFEIIKMCCSVFGYFQQALIDGGQSFMSDSIRSNVCLNRELDMHHKPVAEV